MNIITLNEIMKITLGKNTTRIKDSEIDIYTLEDFDKDLYCVNTVNDNAECIISLMSSKASPVSIETDSKCITSNFMKCRFDANVLDKWYFCYQFNEGKHIEQQIEKYHQGTTSFVKKLNVKIVGELKFNLPDIDKQRVIGKLYKQSIIQKELMLKQVVDMNKYMLTMIRKIEED